MKNWLVYAILLLAFVLRIISLSDYPVGFTPDEASFGYDAYSLLKTGKDQWGNSWPLVLQSFGDGKLPLYSYLAIPTVAIFGLSEFATRLPSAIFGTLAVLAVYLLSKKLFESKNLALLASLMLAVSPWHMSLSRGAFEANLTVFFMSFGVWLFLSKKYSWSALFFGFNLFSYHSARLVTPLIVFALAFWKYKEINLKKVYTALLIFGTFLLLAFYTVFVSGGATRAGDVTIFNPTDKWEGMFKDRYSKVFDGEPYLLAKIFTNKYTYITDQFSNAYSTYLSPQFLFTLGASETTYGMTPGTGVLYPIEALFILFAIYKLTQNKKEENQPLLFLVFWILVSIIPAALTKGPGYAANRAAVMMPAIQMLSAYGVFGLYGFLREKLRGVNKNVWIYAFFGIWIVGVIFFLENYFYKAPRQMAPGMLYGRGDMLAYVKKIEDNYDQIIVSRSLSEPQIYVAFYNRWEPKDFQRQTKDWLVYKELGLPFLDQLGTYRLGKYTFQDISLSRDSEIPKVLLIGKLSEFSAEITPLLTIKYPDQNPAIVIYDPVMKYDSTKDEKNK